MRERELNPELGLTYEPGGWGDLLKGVWMAEIAATIAIAGARPLRFLDPFAGAPDYPLTDAAAARMEAIRGSRLDATLAKAGRLPSSASIVAAAAGGDWDAAIFDRDADRRAAWRGVPGARVVDAASGWELVDPGRAGKPDLVLVDPYDAARDPEAPGAFSGLARLREAGAHLLLYMFNRAPRGASELAAYRRFREELERALGEPWLLGRVPSDGLLPRAWHEVALFEGVGARGPLNEELRGALRMLTRDLAWRILEPHVVAPPGDCT